MNVIYLQWSLQWTYNVYVLELMLGSKKGVWRPKAASSDVVLSQKFHYKPGFHQIKHQCYKPHPFHALAKVVFNTGKAKPQESSPKPKIFQWNLEESAFCSLFLA